MVSGGASLVSLICAQTAIRRLKQQHKAPCKFSRRKKIPLICWVESFVRVLIPFQTDTNEWGALHFSAKCQAAVGLQGGGVGGRVNFKPPLSIVGCVSAWFGKSPCKLCIQGFSVHVHKNKLFYHSPTAVQDIYVNIKWNEKWDDKINACLFRRLTCMMMVMVSNVMHFGFYCRKALYKSDVLFEVQTNSSRLCLNKKLDEEKVSYRVCVKLSICQKRTRLLLL